MLRKAWNVAVTGLLLTGLAACGGDEGSDDEGGSGANCPEGENCAPGSGWTQSLASGSAEITFKGAEAGAKYAVMPYSVGDFATVEGATTTQVTFKFSMGAAAGGSLKIFEGPEDTGKIMDPRDYDQAKRMLLRNFRPDRGHAQAEGFWRMTQRLDRVSELRVREGAGWSSDVTIPVGGIEQAYRQSADYAVFESTHAPKIGKDEKLNLLEGTCPTDTVLIPLDQNSSETDEDDIDDPATQVVDKTSYCLVYLSEPVTESDKAAIESSMEKIMTTYKSIYNDQFAATGEGYTFKPVIVILNIGDDSLWPPAKENPLLQVAGVYMRGIVDFTGVPMLYMASDFSKVQGLGGIKADVAKRNWHATLAHEMQHAIQDYYTRTTNGAIETAAVDEGTAHFFEDAFGYGEDIFAGRAKLFLDAFAFAAQPFLSGTTSVGDGERGGAHAFLYYLASRKGGVTFTDGRPSGGGGLEFMVKNVKTRTENGPQNLAKSFGVDEAGWVDLVGDFLGAVALDGRSLGAGAKVEDVYQTVDPQTGVKDLNGKEDNTFGMKFNGYLQTGDWETNATAVKDVDAGGLALSHYRSQPLVYTVTDPEAKLTVTVDDPKNAAVTVVRIK